MRILFFSDNYPPERNAAATRVSERAEYWVEWGHSVTVITSAPNFPDGRVFEGYTNRWFARETIRGVDVVRVKTFISPNEGFLTRIVDFLSYMIMGIIVASFLGRYDVITATSPQFFAAVAGWFVSRIKRRPFVFELGDLWPATITAVGAMRPGLAIRLIEKLELFLYRQSARIISLTTAFKDDLVSRGISTEKIDVVINGVDMRRYFPGDRDQAIEQEYGLKGKFVVGYLGTLGMSHALENVLNAAEFLQERDDIRIVFVGPGGVRQTLIDDANRRRLANILFIPAQPKERMPQFWSVCSVALVHLKDDPVFRTVIPSKIFEAMAMGLPILLAAPEGEATSVVRGDASGLVVQAERPRELADAITYLADNASDLLRLSENSLLAAPRYSREKQSSLVLKSYIEALEREAT